MPKLLPLIGIISGEIKGALSNAQRHGRSPHPLAIVGGHQIAEGGTSRHHQVVFGYTHIIKFQDPFLNPANPQRRNPPGVFETRHIPMYQDSSYALGAGNIIEAGIQQGVFPFSGACDPVFGSIDNVIASIFDGRSG